jgi:PAS domain S-box-containing protein
MTQTQDTAQLLEQISELEEQNANLRLLEAAIERNAKMFEALLGASHDGIALTRADGSIIRVIRGILGYALHDVEGLHLADLVHREDRETVLEAYRELMIGRKQRLKCEARVKKPEGGYLWVELTITDLLDDPAVMALVNNYRDISVRKRNQLTEAEMALLCDSSSAAVFSVDQTGSVLSWYPACERILGYSPPEMEGAHVHSLMPASLEVSDRASRSAVIESGCSSDPIAAQFLARGGKPVSVELTLEPLLQQNAIQGVVYILRPPSQPAA